MNKKQLVILLAVWIIRTYTHTYSPVRLMIWAGKKTESYVVNKNKMKFINSFAKNPVIDKLFNFQHILLGRCRGDTLLQPQKFPFDCLYTRG